MKTKTANSKICEVRYIVAPDLPTKRMRQAAAEVVDVWSGAGTNDRDMFLQEEILHSFYLDDPGEDGPIPGMKELCQFLKENRCSLYVG